MQANSWHKLFHFHLSFWVWKVLKGREKLQKFEDLENKKSFFDEIKNTFYTFLKAIIWCKNKNLRRPWLVESLVIVQHAHQQNLINNTSPLIICWKRKMPTHFPNLKIRRKTLHFHFSHVSELNFHNCKIIDNY